MLITLLEGGSHVKVKEKSILHKGTNKLKILAIENNLTKEIWELGEVR